MYFRLSQYNYLTNCINLCSYREEMRRASTVRSLGLCCLLSFIWPCVAHSFTLSYCHLLLLLLLMLKHFLVCCFVVKFATLFPLQFGGRQQNVSTQQQQQWCGRILVSGRCATPTATSSCRISCRATTTTATTPGLQQRTRAT